MRPLYQPTSPAAQHRLRRVAEKLIGEHVRVASSTATCDTGAIGTLLEVTDQGIRMTYGTWDPILVAFENLRSIQIADYDTDPELEAELEGVMVGLA